MARRRGGEGTPAAEPDPAEGSGATPDKETQVSVTLKGTADDVTRRLGARSETKPEPKQEGNGHGEKDAFVKALRNAKFVIKVKRLAPREHNGVKTNVEVWSSELPLSYQEIQDEVIKVSGGGKYRVAVIDPASNTTITADTFEVDGDPLVEEVELSEEDQRRIFMEGKTKSASELSEEGLERTARLTAKQIEVETLQQQLKQMRNKDDEGGRRGRAQDDTRIEELDRRLLQAQHAAEIERIQRESDRKIEELKALVVNNRQPVPQQGASEVALILKQMQINQDASDRRFGDLMKTMQDDKMNAMLRELQAIKNKPAAETGGMVETMKSFMMMAKMMGMDVPGGDDDDDDDVDKPWYERLADKYLPKLLGVFEEKTAKGEKVTREEFMREIEGAAKQAEDEAVARATQRVQGNPPARGLPAPVAQLPPPPPPPSVTAAAPSTVTQLPPPPPANAPAPSPVPPKTMTVQEEIAFRASGVLEMLARESELRPNEYIWNYEGAWQSLPEPILEKVCAATDPLGVVDALVIEGVIDPAKVAELKAKISGDPRALAWVARGLAELKEWWTAKQSDPSFDPFADEDGDGEGEGE